MMDEWEFFLRRAEAADEDIMRIASRQREMSSKAESECAIALSTGLMRILVAEGLDSRHHHMITLEVRTSELLYMLEHKVYNNSSWAFSYQDLTSGKLQSYEINTVSFKGLLRRRALVTLIPQI